MRAPWSSAVRSWAPTASRASTSVPVLACSFLLPMLHGAALFTVEDLAADGELHPVQQAMVDQHGSSAASARRGW